MSTWKVKIPQPDVEDELRLVVQRKYWDRDKGQERWLDVREPTVEDLFNAGLLPVVEASVRFNCVGCLYRSALPSGLYWCNVEQGVHPLELGRCALYTVRPAPPGPVKRPADATPSSGEMMVDPDQVADFLALSKQIAGSSIDEPTLIVGNRNNNEDEDAMVSQWLRAARQLP